MKLTKAIEILSESHKRHTILLDQDDSDAIKLGIEALKAVQMYRHYSAHGHLVKLPGETPLRPLHTLGFNTGDDESP